MDYKLEGPRPQMGTSRKGSLIAPFKKLKALLGEPLWDGEVGDKTQCEWELHFDDGTVATIYDWKISIDAEKNSRWEIGGNNSKAVSYVKQVIRNSVKPQQ